MIRTCKRTPRHFFAVSRMPVIEGFCCYLITPNVPKERERERDRERETERERDVGLIDSLY